MEIQEYTINFLIILSALVLVGVLMLRYLDGKQWELVEENKRMYQEVTNPIMGKVSEGYVFIDVYRKMRRNGTYKYKNVKRH